MTANTPTRMGEVQTVGFFENAATHFLRLCPRIQLHEIYHWDVRLRETTSVLPRETDESDPPRSGKLQIDFPFVPAPEEKPGLNRFSFLDAFRLSRKRSEIRRMIARIGYAQLFCRDTSEGESTSESEDGPARQRVNLRCAGTEHPGVMALDVPLDDVREYIRQHKHVTRTIGYEIQASPPVIIEARIDTVSSTDRDEARFEDVQKFRLSFGISSDYKLPTPVLDDLSFEYPLALMWTVGRDSAFAYDPRDQRLRLRGHQEFCRPKERPSDRKYDLKLDLDLQLLETSRLLNLKFLRGSGVIRFPGVLLSSLDAAVYDATGRKVEQPLLEKSSAYHFSIEIDLAAAMARFKWRVTRNLVFDGVIPEEGRLEDIRAVFADAGIQLSEWFSKGNGALDRSVRGIRQLEGEQTQFEIHVHGSTAKVVQKLLLRGGGETTRDVDSGRIVVAIAAEHSNSAALNELLNSVQRLLKERLGRFRVT